MLRQVFYKFLVLKKFYFKTRNRFFIYFLYFFTFLFYIFLYFFKFKKVESNRVLLVSESINSRLLAFSNILKTEYELDYLYLNLGDKSTLKCLISIFRFAKLLKGTNYKLIHCFYGELLPIFLIFLFKHKSQLSIIDYYDTYNGQNNKSRLEKFFEVLIFSKANGITCRDLRIQPFKNKINAFRILITDLIIDSVYEKKFAEKKELHVVNTGWVEFDQGDDSIIEILKQLVTHNIHFHFYPTKSQSIYDFSFFYLMHPELLVYSDFIHFHQTYDGSNFHEILSQYDFGISAKDNCLFGIRPKMYSNNFVKNCGSSRIKDYILSGLSIIVSPQNEFQYFQAKRYGINCIEMDFELFNNPYEVLIKSFKDNNKKNISNLSFANTKKRVLDFYKKVLKTNIN